MPPITKTRLSAAKKEGGLKKTQRRTKILLTLPLALISTRQTPPRSTTESMRGLVEGRAGQPTLYLHPPLTDTLLTSDHLLNKPVCVLFFFQFLTHWCLKDRGSGERADKRYSTSNSRN